MRTLGWRKSFSVVLFDFALYLACPPKIEDQDIENDLLSTLVGRPEMAIFGAICTAALSACYAIFNDYKIGVGLLAATLLAAYQRTNQSGSIKFIEKNNDKVARIVICSRLLWSVVIGVVGAVCARFDQLLLVVMTCCTVTGLSFGAVFTNAAAPQFAKLQVIIILVPFIISLSLSPVPYISWILIQGLVWTTGIFLIIDKTYEKTAALIHAQHRITYLAMNDQLTGLANRAQIMKILDRICANTVDEHSLPSYVLFLDLDGFKQVNDVFGHGAGDELLCGVAKRLNEVAQIPASIGRFGGDEFVVIASNVSYDQIQQLSKKMINAISTPFYLEASSKVSIGVSIGGAKIKSAAAAKALHEADALLYKAKHASKGMAFIQDLSFL